MRHHGITVAVFEDSTTSEKPNAVFPNNWLSMWPDGTIYLYPMATESRRIERSEAVFTMLRKQWNIQKIIDLSNWENDNKFLESTGVMIFDHVHKLVYGCLSVRCDEKLFRDHAQELGYSPVIFRAVDKDGTPIYHTNVLMGIQSHTAVICLEAIKDNHEQKLVEASLLGTGHEVIAITEAQMNNFCGNILEVQNQQGERFIVMSQTAYAAYTPAQRTQLSQYATLLPINIPTIEAIGGGSARCMLAEIFLPTI